MAANETGAGPARLRQRGCWLKILFGVIFFMLYLPIITLIAFSFNDRQARHRLARLHLRQLSQGLEQPVALRRWSIH
jgi:ABC-type spermidine/putrescine transport system permease subunit II